MGGEKHRVVSMGLQGFQGHEGVGTGFVHWVQGFQGGNAAELQSLKLKAGSHFTTGDNTPQN